MSSPTVEEYNQRIVETLRSGGQVIPICDSILGRSFTYLTIKKWIDKGVIPALRIGSRWYVTDDILADWLSANQGKLDYMSGVRGPKKGSTRKKKDTPVETESEGITPEDLL